MRELERERSLRASDRARFNARLDAVQAEKDALQQQVDELNKSLLTMEREKLALSTKVANAESEMKSALFAQDSTLAKKIEALQGKLLAAKEQVKLERSQRDSQLQDHKRSAGDADRKIVALQQRLTNQHTELQDGANHSSELARQLKSSNAANERLHAESLKLGNELKSLRAQFEGCEASAQVLTNEKFQLEESIEAERRQHRAKLDVVRAEAEKRVRAEQVSIHRHYQQLVEAKIAELETEYERKLNETVQHRESEITRQYQDKLAAAKKEAEEAVAKAVTAAERPETPASGARRQSRGTSGSENDLDDLVTKAQLELAVATKTMELEAKFAAEKENLAAKYEKKVKKCVRETKDEMRGHFRSVSDEHIQQVDEVRRSTEKLREDADRERQEKVRALTELEALREEHRDCTKRQNESKREIAKLKSETDLLTSHLDVGSKTIARLKAVVIDAEENEKVAQRNAEKETRLRVELERELGEERAATQKQGEAQRESADAAKAEIQTLGEKLKQSSRKASQLEAKLNDVLAHQRESETQSTVECTQLTSDINALRDELSRHKERAGDLKANVAHLISLRESLSSEVEELSARLDASENARHNTERDATAELKQVRAKCAQRVVRLEHELRTARQASAGQLSREANEREECIAALKEKHGTEQRRRITALKTLKEEVTVLRKSCVSLRADAKSHQTDVHHQLEIFVRDIQKRATEELAAAKDGAHREYLLRAASMKRDSQEELEAQLNQLRSNMEAKSRHDSTELASTIAELNASIAELRVKLDASELRCATLQAQLNVKESPISMPASTQTINVDEGNLRDGNSSELAARTREMADLREQISSVHEESMRIARAESKLRQQFYDAQHCLSMLMTVLQDVDGMSRHCSELLCSDESNGREVGSLLRSRDFAAQVCDSIRSIHGQRARELASLQSRVSTLESDVARRTAATERLESEVVARESELASRNAELKKLRERLQDARLEISGLAEKNTDYARKFRRLEDRCKKAGSAAQLKSIELAKREVSEKYEDKIASLRRATQEMENHYRAKVKKLSALRAASEEQRLAEKEKGNLRFACTQSRGNKVKSSGASMCSESTDCSTSPSCLPSRQSGLPSLPSDSEMDQLQNASFSSPTRPLSSSSQSSYGSVSSCASDLPRPREHWRQAAMRDIGKVKNMEDQVRDLLARDAAVRLAKQAPSRRTRSRRRDKASRAARAQPQSSKPKDRSRDQNRDQDRDRLKDNGVHNNRPSNRDALAYEEQSQQCVIEADVVANSHLQQSDPSFCAPEHLMINTRDRTPRHRIPADSATRAISSSSSASSTQRSSRGEQLLSQSRRLVTKTRDAVIPSPPREPAPQVNEVRSRGRS